MPLSNKDLSDIAREYGVTKSDQTDDKAAIPNIQNEITKKEQQVTRSYVAYNNAHLERATPYETEHRWLNGVTYTTITTSQIETFDPTTGKVTYFFPPSWTKSNAQLQPNANGNPKTTSTGSESYVLNTAIENNGLLSLISLLRNGQSSAVISDTLTSPYSPGDPTIQVSNSGHTNGNILYISGSGTSAAVKITNVSGTTLTITEIVAPQNTIVVLGSSVIENIAGFPNTERQNLTSVTYQNILNGLTSKIITAATSWDTTLSNQLTQLNLNIDNAAQVTTAKNSVNTARTAYSTWFGLSNTGVSGKFVNTSLDNLATAYNARNSFIPTRATQITTALGVVSQDSEGNYSGNGIYLQRFKCMNFIINTSNGPLYQANGLKSAKKTFEQKVANAADKLATYNNIVRYANFTADPVVSTVKMEGLSQFTIGETVLLTGNDLPSISCQLSNIVGSEATLSITIPKEYTKASKSAIIKAV